MVSVLTVALLTILERARHLKDEFVPELKTAARARITSVSVALLPIAIETRLTDSNYNTDSTRRAARRRCLMQGLITNMENEPTSGLKYLRPTLFDPHPGMTQFSLMPSGRSA